jgi:hypothetical protein
MGGVTGTTGEIAVFNQGQFGFGISQNMIAPDVERRIQFGWAGVCHQDFKLKISAGVKSSSVTCLLAQHLFRLCEVEPGRLSHVPPFPEIDQRSLWQG